jgi:coenzyme F420 biosynthesis associated uncharacterized protein
VVAGSGTRTDGSTLLRLRSDIVGMLDDACGEVERESGLPTTPRAELLVVDRHGWIGGNLRSLERLFGDVDVAGAEAKVLAWEGGAFVGLVARIVLAQFDPFRDQLIVVYPNLGDMARGSGLRWLMFHEVTHLAQFRAAPWIPDRIVELGRDVLTTPQEGWAKDALSKLPERLLEIVRGARRAIEDEGQTMPLLDLLPEAQRKSVLKLHALVTLLEGHATLITELIGKRVLPDYEALAARIEQRKRRPAIVKLLESIAGLEMKRQQYVLGRGFCEAVWKHGGPRALDPAWRGPEWVPTLDELRAPDLWLDRVGARLH